MSVTCPFCQSLIAMDPVTGVAPEHCPYCDRAITGTSFADTENQDLVLVAGAESIDDPPHEVETRGEQSDFAAEPPSAPDAETSGSTGSPPPELKPAASKRRKNVHPSFVKPPLAGEAITRDARWPWAVVASLMVLLLLQLVIADRASLAAHPRWRDAITNVCNALRCDIPPWREVGAFTMLARDVRAHPGMANALRIQAAFRNDARWPQPWPQIVVTLSDASGHVTGSRMFSAKEYLGRTPTKTLIATGQTAAVALEVMEPAPDTVSFSFDFR